MSVVDVFTTSEKRLRDLAVSFSRLRYRSCNLARACTPGLRSRGYALISGGGKVITFEIRRALAAH
jgi:hypothetical protein